MGTDSKHIAGARALTAEKRVLVIDDDPSHRKLFCRILNTRGYTCAAAEGAARARMLLDSSPYDILVTDIVMPGESGMELVAAVQSIYPDMAVIMATGVEDAGVYARAAEMGIYGYLIKPVTQSQLLATLESAWIRLSIERDRKRQAQLLAEIIVDRDAQVTRLEAANRKIIAQQAHLIQQERLSALLQLAGATAHEINQPLMVILGYLEMVAMDSAYPGKIEVYADKIKGAAERIVHIVKKIRNLHSDNVVRYNAHDSIIDLDGPVPDQGN